MQAMSWNMAPESISIVVLCIIWIYSRKGNPIPSIKNRLFQASFLATFCAMASNLLSAFLIATLQPYTLALTWAVTLIYFIATPLMGMVYFFYTVANIYEDSPNLKKYLFITAVPGCLYVILVLINPFLHSLFDLSLENGYSQGNAISVTYIVFYFYCLACVLLVAIKGKRVQRSIRVILFSFPIIAALVIVIQMISPNIVLTGSAATCALLLIYLYLQNKQISIDHLTRLPNRGEFLKMLELELKKQTRLTVIVISLRGFKYINDQYGQHIGDALLTEIGAFMRKGLALREGEVYRYGGDEFALLIGRNDEKFIGDVVERVIERMKQPWNVGTCSCMLTAAVGAVHVPDTSDQMESLVNGLEYAVAIAKKDEANHHICYCTAQLLEKAKRRQKISELLHRSLREDKFSVYYQPILNVESGKFRIAEALLRMTDTSMGSISPGEFIPVAEESGLIVDITYMVLDKVCGDIRLLMDMNIPVEGISVNFSALQFEQKDLVERMTEIFKRHDVPCSKIKVEITESTLAENTETVGDYIHCFNHMGISVGLDDFGTGYSNLTSVIGIPFDAIKLDKSLVWSSMNNSRFSIVVQNIVRGFIELGVKVLAEGVENEEQRDFVMDWGCSLIQGFLYAKPMPIDDFVAFLRKNSA